MKSITYIIVILTAFFLGFLSPHGYCQTRQNNKRPKIGLVLSGGGAKGMAHVGVLKVLEEVGMPIDYIGGTSMGGIVGALYAVGYSADSLEKIIKELDWDYLLSDNIRRRDLSITEKIDEDRYLLSFPFGRKGIKLPAGIIRGQHIENKFAKLCAPVYKIRDFNKLPIPFLCVALDIEKGEKVVLNKGYLPDAMRASMSIPSVFEPKVIDGIKMVDGGLVDNLPVRDVIEMGADIIIGVDIGYGSQGKKDDISLFSIMEDAMFVYSARVMKENKKLVDIFIQPDLKGLSTGSFKSADSLIAYGEEEARSVYNDLKHLADSVNSLVGYKYTRKPVATIDSIYIKSIQIKGLKERSEKFTKANMPFSVLEWVTIDEINNTVENIYASNYFNRIVYELQPEEDGARLIINVEEKTGGQLRFGFYYDIDYKATLFLNTTFHNLLLKDSKMSLTFGLGRSPEFEFLYFLDKGTIPAPGVKLSGQWTNVHIFSDTTRKKLATLNYSVTNFKLFLQSNISHFLSVQVGGEWTHARLSPDISFMRFGNLSDNYWGLFASIFVDSYDHPSFPKKGHQGRVVAKFAANVYIPPVKYLKLNYRFARKLSRRTTIIPSVNGGISSGDSIPIQYMFPLGGLTELNKFGHIPFIGYKFYEISNNNVLFARVDFQVEIRKNMYLTLLGNAGYQGNTFNDLFQVSGFISGFGLSYGLDTPVGPLKLIVMKAGERKGILGYVQLGYWF